MAGYGWIITKDYLADEEINRQGRMNYTSKDICKRLIIGEGVEWQTRDDDQNLVHEGRFIGDHMSEDGFAPLDQFSMPDAGATEIYYRDKGVWVIW